MRSRNSLKYRIWHWFFRLNKNDFKKVMEEISATIAIIILFALLLIGLHAFH